MEENKYFMMWISETPHIAVRNSDGDFRVAAVFPPPPPFMTPSSQNYALIVDLLRHANLGAAEEAKPKEVTEDKDSASKEPAALRTMR